MIINMPLHLARIAKSAFELLATATQVANTWSSFLFHLQEIFLSNIASRNIMVNDVLSLMEKVFQTWLDTTNFTHKHFCFLRWLQISFIYETRLHANVLTHTFVDIRKWKYLIKCNCTRIQLRSYAQVKLRMFQK